jgi:hypothetical protein
MKTILRFTIFAACAGWACVALLRAQAPPPRAQPDKDRTQWVESCLKDFESIKAGMTRGQVEAKLSMDGGLQGVSPARFAHPACGYLKIDVEFEFKRNAADQNRAIVDKADKVTKVSKPYIQRPFAD